MNKIFKIWNKNNVEVYSFKWDRIFLHKNTQKSINEHINKLENLESDFLTYLDWKDSFDDWDIWFFIWDKEELDISEFD